MKLKFIGESCVSLENGSIYKARKKEGKLGEYYAIYDECYDWYVYGVKFVEENFEIVEEDNIEEL